jgi:hypothetical protein
MPTWWRLIPECGNGGHGWDGAKKNKQGKNGVCALKEYARKKKSLKEIKL